MKVKMNLLGIARRAAQRITRAGDMGCSSSRARGELHALARNSG